MSEDTENKSVEMPEVSTPMMRQYLEIKRRFADDILFFRMGDFYEMFLDDAVYAARVLDIALTKRQDKVPMCGIPYHAMHNYVHKILESGKNIAVCEQVEDPKNAAGKIVKRDVVRVITPGSIFEEDLLSAHEKRLIAVLNASKDEISILLADVSTGELWLQKKPAGDIEGFLESRGAKEAVTLAEIPAMEFHSIALTRRNYNLSEKNTDEILREMFQVKNIDPFELNPEDKTLLASFYRYMKEIAPKVNINWKALRNENQLKKMVLDDSALKTLEILTDQNRTRKASLAGVLDKTVTSAGRRKLDEFLSAPSFDMNEIKERHDCVYFACEKSETRKVIRSLLKDCHDLFRIINALYHEPRVRHLGALLETMKSIRQIQDSLSKETNLPKWINKNYDLQNEFPDDLLSEFDAALFTENLPPVLDERRFLKPGYSDILDDLFKTSESAHLILKEFENREKEKYKISTLKIKYNKVIGYYIEISRGLSDKAPQSYVRRQTLVNAERFTCDELKDLENKILNAKDDILALQKSIFEGLVQKAIENTDILRVWAERLSMLDVFFSFAEAAVLQKYIRPEIVETGALLLKESRHPVVEEIFREEIFVPNDIELNNSGRHLAVLTGPNMSGKSTFIRQTGLIQIMAQAGSFVPAAFAQLPLADRVFTRIGAFDRLFKGESTFYVEMSECARIFQNFTEKSLILLDEVGRGTSTFDGISIARAMIEYLNREDLGRPKTLFATHYAELAEMIEPDKGIIGLTVSVLEEHDKVVFLRKIIEGKADKSYGIHVAEMAGLPEEITNRAVELLKELETDGLWKQEPVFQTEKTAKKSMVKRPKNIDQLSMFS
ncbi:MAG: DNA mismatch repair protein MutS [Spirochaetia bacterium]|nr:DNA mismatch repair protein MutS [Spirochaetia bacterium]